MKKYIFVVWFADNTNKRIYGDYSSDADALKSARETLNEYSATQIDVFEARRWVFDPRFKIVSWILGRWIDSYSTKTLAQYENY